VLLHSTPMLTQTIRRGQMTRTRLRTCPVLRGAYVENLTPPVIPSSATTINAPTPFSMWPVSVFQVVPTWKTWNGGVLSAMTFL
jgi:hypothetical protein